MRKNILKENQVIGQPMDQTSNDKILSRFQDVQNNELKTAIAAGCFATKNPRYAKYKNLDCIYSQQTEGNAINAIGGQTPAHVYACTKVGGPLYILNQENYDFLNDGTPFTPNVQSTWPCPAFSNYQQFFATQDVIDFIDAAKNKGFEIKKLDEIDYNTAISQSWNVVNLLDFIKSNEGLSNIDPRLISKLENYANPVRVWVRGSQVKVEKGGKIADNVLKYLRDAGYSEEPIVGENCKPVDVSKLPQYQRYFTSSYTMYLCPKSAASQRLDIKSLAKELKKDTSRFACRKSLDRYVDFMRTCPSSLFGPDLDTYKDGIRDCVNKFSDFESSRTIQRPRSQDLARGCQINFKLDKTYDGKDFPLYENKDNNLKNIIRENLIKLSIRKGLI
jgi:hypothetical protein